jgi:hypothetical protein
MESMGVPRLTRARSAWSSWFASGGGVGWGRERDREECAALPRPVCAWRGRAAQGGVGGQHGRRGSEIDREATRSAVLEKLGVPELTSAEVDRDREGVDQEEFLQVSFSLLVRFR